MQCKSLTLSAYLVLQQLSLSQTARPYFTKCIKTLNIFVATFFSPDIFGLPSSFFLSCVFWIRIFFRITNLTFQARTTAHLTHQVNMADTQKTTTGATVITNSYAPNNGLFNCFDDMSSCLVGSL